MEPAVSAALVLSKAAKRGELTRPTRAPLALRRCRHLGVSVPLPRRHALQHPDRPPVAADDAVQLVDVAVLKEVAQHPKDAPRARVERALREHLVAAAHAVFDRSFL